MSNRQYYSRLVVSILFILTSVGAMSLFAQDNAKSMDVPKNTKDYAERAQNAADVLTQIMSIPEDGIPEELMSRAKGIAVIPRVVKGAFGIGGRYGKGLMAQRTASGKWSTPAFVEIGGGSFGLQLGVEATDLVLVFMNDEGIKSLLEGKVTLGADAAAAAGPVGRKASAATDVKMGSSILSYSRSKGLFAGVSLEGAALTVDDSANRKVYGKNLDGKAILISGKVASNSVVAPFVNALQKYSPSKPTSRQ
jgi:lipid-binding SYLF domain-containing protein